MTKKASHPSIKETAFDCPHCGAFTTQYWFNIYAEKREDDSPFPNIPNAAFRLRIREDKEIPGEEKIFLLDWFNKMDTGLVFLEYSRSARSVRLIAPP